MVNIKSNNVKVLERFFERGRKPCCVTDYF